MRYLNPGMAAAGPRSAHGAAYAPGAGWGRQSMRPGAVALAALGIVGALAVGVVVGGITDAAQARVPQAASFLAHSGGSWVLVTFLVALTTRSRAGAVAQGAVCLVGLVAGYYMTAGFRHLPVDRWSALFWLLAAMALGPPVGLAAAGVRLGRPLGTAIGSGVVGGLLAGEALFELHRPGAAGSGILWAGQFGLGIALAVGLALGQGRRLRVLGPSLLILATVAAATVGAYAGA
jgi:hypothetical protein